MEKNAQVSTLGGAVVNGTRKSRKELYVGTLPVLFLWTSLTNMP